MKKYEETSFDHLILTKKIIIIIWVTQYRTQRKTEN